MENLFLNDDKTLSKIGKRFIIKFALFIPFILLIWFFKYYLFGGVK